MKTLLISFLFFFGINSFAQTKLDITKIENYCFEYHNDLRPDTSKRKELLTCKKASDLQLNYIVTSGTLTHDNPNVGLETLSKRFDKFNKDSVRYVSKFHKKGYVNIAKYSCEGEIATVTRNLYLKKSSDNESEIAKRIIKNFMDSPFHKYSLLYVARESNGHFSVNVQILSEDEEYLVINVYCVAVFAWTK